MSKTMHTIDVYAWVEAVDIVSNSIPVDVPNRNGAFIFDSEATSVNEDGFVLEGRPQVVWDSVGLFDIAADDVTIEIVDGPVYSATKHLALADPLSDEFPNITRCVFTDLPSVDPVIYPDALIRVTLSAPGRLAHLGFFVTGPRTDLFACVLYGTSLGITDYSRKERDDFGEITLIERGYSNWINYTLGYDETLLSEIRDYLASRRVALTVYVGFVKDPEVICLGYYRDFNINVSPGPVAEGTLEVESIVYDKPATWSEYEVNFGTFDALTCDYDGDYKYIELIGGLPTDTAYATIKDRPVLPSDVVRWYATNLEGHQQNVWSTSVITTPCGDLNVWQWPGGVPGPQETWRIKLQATITVDNGTRYSTKPAFLYVGGDTCSACLPDVVSPAWSGGGESAAGIVEPAAVMVEIPAYTQVPIDNTGAGHRYFWIELPDNLSSVRVQTAFVTGTATDVWAKLWNPCDGELPDESSPYSGVDFTIHIDYADRNFWTAVLVRVDDGTYTGTIERLITLQLPTP